MTVTKHSECGTHLSHVVNMGIVCGRACELYAYNTSLAWRNCPNLAIWDCLGMLIYYGMLTLELTRQVERSSFLALTPYNQDSSALKGEGSVD